MSVPTILVGPFGVVDLPADEVIRSSAALAADDFPRLAFALHVGGLAHAASPRTVDAYDTADIVYADGASIVMAAKAGGARRIERAATTDIGVPILEQVAQNLGRPLRLCLIGGEDGLARAAGDALESRVPTESVLCFSGFHAEWEPVLAEVRDARPDVLVVGLGAPREMHWAVDHRQLLPPALVITCGGWFNFLAGRERRAPRVMQQAGLEWVFRILHDPRGKAWRYLSGAWYTAGAIIQAVVRRIMHVGGPAT